MKILRLRRLDSENKGADGIYFKLKDGKGVKVLHGRTETLTDLINKGHMKDALQEAKNLKAAYPSGVVPKCYEAVAVRQGPEWRAGILMEHISGNYPSYEEEERAIDYIETCLERVGIIHNDLNLYNIIVKNIKGRNAYYAVDFSCITYL